MNRYELVEKLSKLSIEKNFVKRQLDTNYDVKRRTKFFNELKRVEKEIEETKFKLRLLKEIDTK
jgi:hypothetical protein